MTPNRLWISLFSVWVVLLSGVAASVVGSPGILQAVRLKDLLAAKQSQIGRVEQDLIELQSEALQLEKSRVAQQREIRKVLGYAARDEIIFDFAHPESSDSSDSN